tara:strand:- start:5417 stop:5899 length:483 start_codon:yes stop_codon:yes gene_type:complete
VKQALESEFETLVRAHAPSLINWFARRVVPRSEAEDLAQEAFLVVYHRRDEVKGDVRAFLFGVARRLLAAHHRKTSQRSEAVRAFPPPPPDSGRQLQALSALDLGISALPPELEEAVLSYYSHPQRTYQQASEHLGVSRATLQSRLRRAKSLLRSTLDVQ